MKSLSKWLLSAATSIGFGLLQFVFAIVIAGLLMSRSETCRRLAVAVAVRIEGGGETNLLIWQGTPSEASTGALTVPREFIQGASIP